MKLLKTLLLVPYFLVALLTGAKSFRDNPILGSHTLNRIGLHVARAMLAHTIMRVRWLILAPLMPRLLRKEYRENGFVSIPDFITETEVAALRREISQHTGPVRQLTQGDTATQRILLDKAATENAPALKALTKNPVFARYLAYTGGKIMAPLLYIQRIQNGHKTTGKQDPQKNIHSDTFHPTMKAWLFLQDVKPEHGPFTYVKGSHRFTALRRAWEYERSLGAATLADKYSEKGSFRATADDLASMQLPAPMGICVKAGTLVIANTNGFHGRGQADPNATRLEIWAYSRHNPFNPFPGFTLPGLQHIRHWAMHRYWHFKDRQAEKRGTKASWHLIPADQMLLNTKGKGKKSA